MTNKVHPCDGGCWYCHTKDDKLVFCWEFDTYIHEECAQKAFAEMTEATWNPLVIRSDERYLHSCKVKVVLKGDDLTKLTIVQNGVISRGEGWDFLHPFFKKNNNCRGAAVKLHTRVKKLWNVAKKAGLSLEATQMVLRLDKAVEEDAYADDAELLA